MGAAENLEIHRRWSDDNDRHDLSNYHDYMHDDIEVRHLDGATVVGIDAVRENMANSIAAMPDRRVIVDDRFATDDRVVCRWRVAGSPKARSDGGRVEAAGISVWEFRGRQSPPRVGLFQRRLPDLAGHRRCRGDRDGRLRA